jgi:hypothetical protein
MQNRARGRAASDRKERMNKGGDKTTERDAGSVGA